MILKLVLQMPVYQENRTIPETILFPFLAFRKRFEYPCRPNSRVFAEQYVSNNRDFAVAKRAVSINAHMFKRAAMHMAYGKYRH